MRKFTKKQYLAAGAAAVIIAGGAGAAFAYWSTTGTGSGTATSSTGASNLTITQTVAPSDLAPGVAAGTISGTVTNNATNDAYVNTVTVSIASVSKAAGAPAGTCDETDYTLSGAVMSVATDLGPSGSSTPSDTAGFTGATLGFNNKATNQDACKGATVHLAYASN